MGRTSAIAGLFFAAIAVPAFAADNNDIANRLRAALRAETARAEALEESNSALQAAQARLEREKANLNDKVTAGEAHSIQQQKRIEEQTRTLAETSQQLEATQQSLTRQAHANAKLRDEYRQLEAQARARDTEAKRLDAALIDTRKRVLACEAKNARLYEVGTEILNLYKGRGVLDVLLSREPVTGLERVKLDNLVQRYEDKLRDARIVHPH